MISGTRIDGRDCIRCAILSFRTHIEHVDEAIEAIVDAVAVPMAKTIAETERLRLRNRDADDLDGSCSTPTVRPSCAGSAGSGTATNTAAFDGSEVCARLGHTLWIVERKADGELLGFCGLKRVKAPARQTPATSRSAGACARMPGGRAMPRKPRSRASTSPSAGSARRMSSPSPSRGMRQAGLMERLGMTRRDGPRFHRPALRRRNSTRRSSSASKPRNGRRRGPRRSPSSQAASRSLRSSPPGGDRSRHSAAAASIAARSPGAMPPLPISAAADCVDVAERPRRRRPRGDSADSACCAAIQLSLARSRPPAASRSASPLHARTPVAGARLLASAPRAAPESRHRPVRRSALVGIGTRGSIASAARGASEGAVAGGAAQPATQRRPKRSKGACACV